MSDSNSHRQLLVRCDVRNSAEEHSVRFVEHSVYRLWQYMMANRHGITVQETALCLWLPEAEWNHQSDLFHHAGTTELVNRINIAVYDPISRFCNTVQRFVSSQDSFRVEELLMGRISTETRNSDDVVMEVDTGMAIVREGLADLVNLGYALTDAQLTALPDH
jgi:hypothetical protein